MMIIDKDYISKKLAKRQGQCLKCGQCCRGCKHLKDNLCLVYENRPFYCHQDFPIDQQDLDAFGIKNCGYSFEK